jgi:hypothetical protein
MSLRTITLLGIAVLALAAPASALATQTYSDTISGYEYYATSTDGKFAGTASGALLGDWNADVQHRKLCLSCTPTARITGGSFALATTLSSISTLITGSFTGGTIRSSIVALAAPSRHSPSPASSPRSAPGTAATAAAPFPPPSPTTGNQSSAAASPTLPPLTARSRSASERLPLHNRIFLEIELLELRDRILCNPMGGSRVTAR